MMNSKDHFFKTAPIAAGILSADSPRFTILDVNLAYVEMMKVPAEDLLGKGVFEAYPDLEPDGRHGAAHLMHALEETIRTKETMKVPLMKYDTLGSGLEREEKYWEATYIPLLDERREVVEILVEVKEVTTDITALLGNQPDTLLADLDLKFRNIFDLSSAGIALVSLEGKWIEVNPQVPSLLGYSRWELLNSDFQRYTHPEDVDEDLMHFHRLVSGEIEKFEAEKRYYHRSGKLIWTMVNVSLVRKETGEPHYFVMHILDITAKKEMELTLQQSQLHYQSLFSQNPDAVYSFDLDGKFISANQATYILTEMPEEKLIGSLFLTLIPLEDKRQAYENFLSACQGTPTSYQTGLITANGKSRTLQVLNMPIVADGEIVGVYGTAKDITDKVKAENKLHQAKIRYEQLVTTIDGIVWEADENLQFTYVSPQASQILGYPIEDWHRPDFLYNHVHVKDKQKLWKNFLDGMNSGENFSFEFRMISSDGKTVWLCNKVTVITKPGRKTLLRGVITDTTRAKTAEMELLQFKKVIENSQEGIGIINLKTKEVYRNPSLQRSIGIEGKSKLPFSGKMELYENPNKGKEVLDTLLAGEYYASEVSIINPQGKKLDFFLSGGPIFDDSDNLVAVFGIHTALNDREEMVSQLKKQMAKRDAEGQDERCHA